MKHHYMRISRTCVRIELIAEDNEERTLLQQLSGSDQIDELLDGFFRNALNIYHRDAKLSSKTFMEFPRVALCYFELVESHASIEIE